MNEEFLTRALEEDRGLKAYRLVNRFEADLEALLRDFGRQLVESNPELFLDAVEFDPTISLNSSTIIANARDNLELARVNREDPSNQQYLNISVRWVDPLDWGESGVDGALCATCYKINNGNAEDFSRVKQQTLEEDWTLRFAEDQFNNAPGIIYIPVETAGDIQEAIESLIEHFGTFGDHWGALASELDEASFE